MPRPSPRERCTRIAAKNCLSRWRKAKSMWLPRPAGRLLSTATPKPPTSMRFPTVTSLIFAAASGGLVFCLANGSVPAAGIVFQNQQPHSGVPFVLNNCTTPDKPIIDSVLGGVALLDFDGDGYLDLFFTNGAPLPSLMKEGPADYNRLYRNNHDGTFTDVTDAAGVRGEGYSMGVAAADYDNDGWTDLFVAGVNRNILYRNNGDGTFTDVTTKAG